MVDRKYELIFQEDDRWIELHSFVHRIDPKRLLEPGVNGEWTGKDLLAHLACWMAEAANKLEQMRFGTYENQRIDLDATNERFYEACKDLSLSDVHAEMESARTRMFQEWDALPELTPEAEEWFIESGPAHVDEHLPQLRKFIEGTGGA